MGDTAENTQYDFFISFAEDAKEWVYGVLVPKLGRTGKRFALEGQELTGQFWLNDLQKNIEQSHTVLLILSPQYLTSERTELIKQMALLKVVEQRQWRVIPILLKSVERELVMRVIDGIDLTKNYENEDRLNDLLGGQLPSLDEQAYLATPPYPGMQAFTEKEAGWFFGREDEVDQYVKMLCDQQIVVLTGASGCGKSSLARAGIVPILEAKKQFVVKIIRPNHLGLDGWLEQLASLLQRDSYLAKEFLFKKKPDAKKFLLLIDQFEELFNLDSNTEHQGSSLNNKAKKLLIVLADLKKILPEFHLLLTLRAEFFPQLALCQPYINLDNYLQRVNALGRDGLSAAITKPALKKGVFIDERLIERLVNDAGDDPGILPFVQEVMRELWEQRVERYIGLDAYEHLGRKSGSGLKASIAAKADAAYKVLTDTDKKYHKEKGEIARRIFMRLLQFGEGKPDTRRQQSIAALRSDQDSVGVFEETLQHLSSEKYRLLTVNREQNDEDSKVDIVHEALIKAWPMLRDWIKNFKSLEEKRRIFDIQVSEWLRLGKGSVGLLDGQQLKEIKTTLNENKKIFILDKEGGEFLKESDRNSDPGWSYKSVFLVCTLFLTFLATNFFMFNWLANNEMINSFYYYLLFLIFLTFFSLNTKGRKNKLQKIGKYFSEKKLRFFSVLFFCGLVLSGTLENNFFKFLTEYNCSEYGINTTPVGMGAYYNNFIIDYHDSDEEYINVFLENSRDTDDVASRIFSFYKLANIKNKKCLDFFSNKITFFNKNGNFSAKVQDLKSNQIYYLYSDSDLSYCSSTLDLSYKLLRKIDPVYKNYPVSVYKGSCKAVLLDRQCKKEKNEDSCLRSIQDSNYFLNAYINLSERYFDNGKNIEALNLLTKLKSYKKSVDHILTSQLAKAYLYTKDYESAEKEYLTALKLNNHPKYLIQLAIVYREMRCDFCFNKSAMFLDSAEKIIRGFEKYKYSNFYNRYYFSIVKNKAILFNFKNENKKSNEYFKILYTENKELFAKNKEEIYYYLAINYIKLRRPNRGCSLLNKRNEYIKKNDDFYIYYLKGIDFKTRSYYADNLMASYCN